MGGFNNIADLASAYDEGRMHSCTFRKVPSQNSLTGDWADLSMAAGNPKPNYYASTPLVAATLDGFDGLFHGDNKSPQTKHLLALGATAALSAYVPGRLILLDYLLYYPFVDGDAVGETQAMNNTVTLPRYSDGDGVRVMAVAVAPTTGTGSFTFDYIDADGVSRTSPVQTVKSSALAISALITSGQAEASGGQMFLRQTDAKGVRQITSVNVVGAIGGLFALVLVRPLADLVLYELNVTAEVNFWRQRPILPRIYDGAYLNFIANVTGSIAGGPLTGYANFVWSK